jgi:hypothetical protein
LFKASIGAAIVDKSKRRNPRLVIPGRREAASPESKDTERAGFAPSVFLDSGLAGFARDPE